MTRQSMARVSSASMEADYVPGMVPFDWEAAPGRPAKQSIKPEFYANAVTMREVEIEVEMRPLQLPPGQRPKDGFYLPYSRPVEYPNLRKEPSGIMFQARNFFNLKFPGLSSKKPLFRSRMGSAFESSYKPSKIHDDSHVSCVSSIFNPLSGHRFGSRVTKRMFLEFRKKHSSLKRCLPSKPWSENHKKRTSSHDDPHRGRRLDSVDEDYVTAANFSPSEASTPSSPGHARNSSPVAKKQLSVPASSRFMASMLLSLCPDDSDEAEGNEADGISDDHSDEISVTQLVRPRARNSSPEARFQTSLEAFECLEIVRDPATPTLSSHSKFTHPAPFIAKVDMSIPQATHGKEMARSMPESLNEKLDMAGPSEKLDALTRSHSVEKYAKKSDQNIISANEDNTNAYWAFSDAVSEKEPVWTRESCKSSFSWKSCRTRCRQNQGPTADFVTSNAQEPVDSEQGKIFSDFEGNFKKIFEDTVEEYERRGSNNSVARSLSTRNCEFIWPQHNSLSTSIGKDAKSVLPSESGVILSMVSYLSPPRSSDGDSEYSFVTSSSDKPDKGFARWRSRDPSLLRETSLQERLELNQPPASEPISNDLHRLPSTILSEISIKGSKIKAPTSTSAWMEALKPSSLSPATPSEIPIETPHASAGNDYTDESDEDSESSSTNSSDYQTPRAVWHPPSLSTPVLRNYPSPKPAKWIVTEKRLKSSSLLHATLQRQLNHESPSSSSFMMHQDLSPTSPSTSSQRVMARSHSVRTRIHTSRAIFAAPAYPTISVDVNAKGPDLAPASRLSKTNSNVMSKVAQWEARAGLGSSGKPLPKLNFRVREA